MVLYIALIGLKKVDHVSRQRYFSLVSHVDRAYDFGMMSHCLVS